MNNRPQRPLFVARKETGFYMGLDRIYKIDFSLVLKNTGLKPGTKAVHPSSGHRGAAWL
jgi:hypothetical protein